MRAIFEDLPCAALLVPRERTRYFADRHFADGESRPPARWELQDFRLNVRGEPDQLHDLAHPLARETPEPGQIRVISCLASLDHVLELDGEGHDLRDSGQTPVPRRWRT